jgi:hypothetical protein
MKLELKFHTINKQQVCIPRLVLGYRDCLENVRSVKYHGDKNGGKAIIEIDFVPLEAQDIKDSEGNVYNLIEDGQYNGNLQIKDDKDNVVNAGQFKGFDIEYKSGWPAKLTWNKS